MVHINEGKGKLGLFNTKDNVLLTPHPSYSSAIDLFPFLILLFSFNFYPRTHLPYIDPTSTLHGPHNDPTPQLFFPTTTFLLFSSTTTTTTFSVSLLCSGSPNQGEKVLVKEF